jgi:hypothetical protein
MKMNFRVLALAAIAALAFVAPRPADAAQALLCQPDVSGASSGSRTVGGTLSPVPSGTVYVLNSFGCALIQQADIGYFLSQGYTQSSSESSIIFTTGVAAGTTDFVIGTLPPKALIKQIVFSNAIAAAVTGGISIGTTANGTQVVAAQAVGASTDAAVASYAIVLPVPFTTGLGGALHMAAVTAWNGANVTVTVIYSFY